MQHETTPLHLRKKIGKKFSNLCKVMQDLTQRGILEQIACDGKCKMYRLTEKGNELAALLKRDGAFINE